MWLSQYLKANGRTVADVSFLRCNAGFSGGQLRWEVTFKDGTTIANMIPGRPLHVDADHQLGMMAELELQNPPFPPDAVREQGKIFYAFDFESTDGTDPNPFQQRRK